jgi:RecG-like helicase
VKAGAGPRRKPTGRRAETASKQADRTPVETPDSSATPPPAPHPSLAFATPAVQEKLTRLGVQQLSDLILHLPLRYEDETQVQSIREAPSDQTVQVEGTVAECDIRFRPRRQLVCRVEDASGTLYIRFLNFYPSQVKQLAPGTRVRVLGDIRQGFFGAEMVHPRVRVLRGDAPLPESLTPVYPTTAGLPQEMLRKMAGRALKETPLDETLPQPVRRKPRAVCRRGAHPAPSPARCRRARADLPCPPCLATDQVRRAACAAALHAAAP